MSQTILKKILQIKKQIQHHDNLYYNLDKPEISDYEYDLLYKKLEKLESEYPDLKTEDSPTQKVPGKALDKFEKKAHSQMMLSLQNSYSKEDLSEFHKRIIKWLKLDTQKVECFMEPKFDGVAVELIYEKGLLTTALSRGDGKVGENITQNIKTIRGLPLKLKMKNPPKLLEIRGEVLILKKDFESINKKQEEIGEPSFANPRNLAAGTLRQLDPILAAKRPLRFYAHSLGSFSEDFKIKSQSEFMKSVEKSSVPCLKITNSKLKKPFNLCKVSSSLNDLLKYYDEIDKLRHSLPFEIDGIVIKINSFEYQKQLGKIARSPRWAVAGKFAPEETETQVEDIILQVGRTGVVTPVAVMKPANIGGVTIRNASLHNFQELARKDVRKGDFVVVHRAGDVIPEIIKSLKEKRKKSLKKFPIPKKCPICKSQLEKDGDYLKCFDTECPAVKEQSLIHFASKSAMNIEFLGIKSIKKFYEWGWLTNFSSFYDLPKKPLSEKEGFGEKSFHLLKQSLEKSKNTSLERLIFALGIGHVGEQTAQKVAEKVVEKNSQKKWNLDNAIPILQGLTQEELEQIPDIGQAVAKSIIEAFKNKKLIKDLKSLYKHGIHLVKEQKSSELKGLQFVITGTLPVSRDKVKKMLEQKGAKVSSQVSKNTNYVIEGENPGSKKQKAITLSVPLIDWNKFQKIISN